MTPQTVNAVNLPVMNAMNFPAAILQPPYFDPEPAGGHGLRRHRRDHRARDQPQLRRPGRAVRRRPAGSSNWWTRRRTSSTSRRPRRSSSSSTTRYRPFPDLAVNGKLTPRREHRGRGGPGRRLRRVPRCRCGGQPGAGRGGLTGDQQFFVELRPELARQGAGARCCASRSWATATPRTSTAPTPCATSTPGTPRSTSSRARSCTWRPRSASRVW